MAMNKMRFSYISKMLLLGVALLSMTGCNEDARVQAIWFTREAVDAALPDRFYTDTDVQARALTRKLLGSLQGGDREKLKSLLCEKTLSIEGIDEQIDEAMRFFEGEITSTGIELNGGARSRRNWRYTAIHIYPCISDVKTDKGKTYEVNYSARLIYDKDKSQEGVMKIRITDEANGRTCTIGEYWKQEMDSPL
ncbi:MAG: DUF5104 domain-containing protein [Clostridiales Family XIII bacterium]|jgi:hypothetical protein|nr:DUF5104 domain-containing protein [Clostridiales Family XIII bacterium]